MTLKGERQDIIDQIQEVLPDYPGGNWSVRFNTDKEIIEYDGEGEPITENADSPSGYRADIFEHGREVLTPAEYDLEGNEITPAVLGDYIFQVDYPVFIQELQKWRENTTVSLYKIKIVLESMGDLNFFNTIVENQSVMVQLAWKGEPMVRRLSPTAMLLAQAKPYTPEQVDQIFINADQLQL